MGIILTSVAITILPALLMVAAHIYGKLAEKQGPTCLLPPPKFKVGDMVSFLLPTEKDSTVYIRQMGGILRIIPGIYGSYSYHIQYGIYACKYILQDDIELI